MHYSRIGGSRQVTNRFWAAFTDEVDRTTIIQCPAPVVQAGWNNETVPIEATVARIYVSVGLENIVGGTRPICSSSDID